MQKTLILAGILAVALVGCGEKKEEMAPASAPAAQEEMAPAAAQEEMAPAAQEEMAPATEAMAPAADDAASGAAETN